MKQWIHSFCIVSLVAYAMNGEAAPKAGRYIAPDAPSVSMSAPSKSIEDESQLTQKKKLSLQEAVFLALRHNPDIKNSELDRITAKYAYNLVENAYRWHYGLDVSAAYNRTKVDGFRLPDTNHVLITPTAVGSLPTGAGVALELDEQRDSFNFHPQAKLAIKQPLLRGVRRAILYKPHMDAMDQEQVSRIQLKQQIATTVMEVTRAYRALILANHNIETAKQSLVDMQDTFRKNAKQIQLGTLPSTTNIGVEAQLASLKLRLFESQNAAKDASQNLLQAIGLEPDLAIEVPSDVSLEVLPLPNLDEAIEHGLQNNGDFQQVLLNEKQHERDLIQAKDNLLWKVDVSAAALVGGGGATHARKDLHLGDLFNGRDHGEEFDLNVNIPIDNYAEKAAVKMTKLQLEKDQNNIIKAKQNLEKEIKNKITRLQDLAQQVVLAKQSIELERKNYNLQVKKQELGKGTAMDVTTSQNALIQSRISYMTTKIDYLNARAELDEKLGDLVDRWGIQIRY